ncbi:YlmC/YmxH family sporulation protein [Desulfitobacterium sp. THU1]|uniref:YlmC/YmxH family sporulation protein n=1 Tax=Desulfitobacterium sp. THU1 TaxID=3138072 RepID=UPI00311E4544
MLLSDLAGKEIINLHDGSKLGLVGDADLAIAASGSIEAIILTSRSGFAGFWGNPNDRDRDLLVIPWDSIKKVGAEVIIVDMSSRTERINKYSV